MNISQWRLRQALHALSCGGVIAYPTEAVYGLGCDPMDEDAVLRILALKQRPIEKGMILVAADFNQLQDFIQPVSAELLAQLEKSWPGHVTWVLPARADVPEFLTGAHDTLAVRVTAHAQTAALCRAFGGPIVSTSANISGLRPARNSHQVHWQIPEVDYVMPGACGGALQPSTIRDGRTGAVLR